MNKALCLDLGTTTGYSIIDLSSKEISIATSGSVKLQKDKTGKREYQLREFILMHKASLAWVIYEDIPYAFNHKGGNVIPALTGVVNCTCYEYDIPCMGINVSTIKKEVTGSGKATKELVMKAVKEQTGITPRCHNEADAIAVALSARKRFC